MKKLALAIGLLLTGGIMTAHAETAIIKTSMGTIECQLFTKEAPNTVENFAGLATGTKEFKDPKTGEMVKRPFYNGLIFHRVIPDFMIQGGDPLGTGAGGPDYKFADEYTAPKITFDQPGRLAMANSGPNTNGSQFFITVANDEFLNDRPGSHYTIFGQVIKGQDVADAISKVPTGSQDRPLTQVTIESITIQK